MVNPTRLLGIVIAVIVGITAIHLAGAVDFPSNSALTEQTRVPLNHRVLLKALDLSRTPTREELMAAGQLAARGDKKYGAQRVKRKSERVAHGWPRDS